MGAEKVAELRALKLPDIPRYKASANGTLKTLLLSHNTICGDDATALGECLKSNMALEKLELYGMGNIII